jgi:hypothetical protein
VLARGDEADLVCFPIGHPISAHVGIACALSCDGRGDMGYNGKDAERNSVMGIRFPVPLLGSLTLSTLLTKISKYAS